MSILFLKISLHFCYGPRTATLQPAFVPQSRDYGVINFTDDIKKMTKSKCRMTNQWRNRNDEWLRLVESLSRICCNDLTFLTNHVASPNASRDTTQQRAPRDPPSLGLRRGRLMAKRDYRTTDHLTTGSTPITDLLGFRATASRRQTSP